MRKSTLFLAYLAFNLLLVVSVYGYSRFRESHAVSRLEETRALVKRYELTDLCLFTEASYTRHLTQTDWHTPFQDAPVALEHFPSGSFLMPPAILKRSHDQLD